MSQAGEAEEPIRSRVFPPWESLLCLCCYQSWGCLASFAGLWWGVPFRWPPGFHALDTGGGHHPHEPHTGLPPSLDQVSVALSCEELMKQQWQWEASEITCFYFSCSSCTDCLCLGDRKFKLYPFSSGWLGSLSGKRLHLGPNRPVVPTLEKSWAPWRAARSHLLPLQQRWCWESACSVCF